MSKEQNQPLIIDPMGDRELQVKLCDVFELLNNVTEHKLTAEETAAALPILEGLRASGAKFTLREVIAKFQDVDELSSFASLCDSHLLVGGDYSQYFTNNKA